MIGQLIRRATGTLVLFCLAATAAADSYHPDIVKSQVVTLDAKAIESAANSSTPFELVLGETHLTVVLSPAPLWPEEGVPLLEVGKDGAGTKRTVKGNLTYAGDVVGEDPAASEARFSIVRGVLDGYVLSSTGWWFIEPLSRFDRKAGPDQYLVYATQDLDFTIDYGDDDAQPDGGYNADDENPDPRIPLLMVADMQYANLEGEATLFWEHQATLVNDVNGIYRDQIGQEFRIGGYAADVGGHWLKSTNAAVLLTELEVFLINIGGLPYWNSKLAHLTTAKDLNGNTEGKARGSEIAVSRQRLGTTRRLAFQNMMLAAHEIGHNFNAVHGEADRWCKFKFNFWCVYYEQTIMSEAFSNSLPFISIARFSDGTRNCDHNNAKRIRDNMRSRNLLP